MNKTLQKKLKEAGLTEAQIKGLGKLGVADEADMQHVQESDLVELGVPVIKARKLLAQFTAGTTTDESENDIASALGLSGGNMMLLLAGGGNLADLVDPVELLKLYKPDKPGHPVTRILKAKFNSRRVIAFKPGTREVAVPETAAYLRELEQGYSPRDFVKVGDVPVKLWIVGSLPDNLVPENPLYRGEALRGENEECVRTGQSWKGVVLEIRQFLAIGVGNGEIRIPDVDRAMDLIERAHETTLDKLRGRYPRTSIEYDERKTRNTLPTLTIELGGGQASASPFSVAGTSSPSSDTRQPGGSAFDQRGQHVSGPQVNFSGGVHIVGVGNVVGNIVGGNMNVSYGDNIAQASGPGSHAEVNVGQQAQSDDIHLYVTTRNPGDVNARGRDVIIMDNGSIGGDLTGARHVTMKSGHIGGDLHATGTVMIERGCRIGGDVYGDVVNNLGSIGGDVHASRTNNSGHIGGNW